LPLFRMDKVRKASTTTSTQHVHQASENLTHKSKASITDENCLTADPSSWHGSSLLSVNQIAPSGLSLLFDTTRSMRAVVHKFGGDNLLQHKLLAAVFYGKSRFCLDPRFPLFR
jgi:hypothetical protein